MNPIFINSVLVASLAFFAGATLFSAFRIKSYKNKLEMGNISAVNITSKGIRINTENVHIRIEKAFFPRILVSAFNKFLGM